jgi:ketosteroid isomerase-like protein
MGADEHIKTIQTVYEAFGRGDVAAIAEAVTDDVDWAAEAAGKAAPWYGDHRGPEGVGEFFAAFGSTMDVEEFTPLTFAATDTEVLTVVRFAAKSRATGRREQMHLHHYFRFRDGKIAYYRGTEDTAQTEATLKGN